MVEKGNIVMVHVDYENIRWRFRDYVEYITIGDIAGIDAKYD